MESLLSDPLIQGATYGVRHRYGDTMCWWSEERQAFVSQVDFSLIKLEDAFEYWTLTIGG